MPYCLSTRLMEAFRALHWADIPFPASRMIDRNQVCAASVFIRGCQAMKYLNVPSTAGALTIFKEAFEASNSAMSLGTVATNEGVRSGKSDVSRTRSITELSERLRRDLSREKCNSVIPELVDALREFGLALGVCGDVRACPSLLRRDQSKFTLRPRCDSNSSTCRPGAAAVGSRLCCPHGPVLG